MVKIREYNNGDCLITLYENGTRRIEGNTKTLKYPLNIDIRVSTKCSFGMRKDGTVVLCNFCHESAKVDGIDCNYEKLKSKLIGLPSIELAIGCNELTPQLYDFLEWCKINNFICNLTINSGHIKRDKEILLRAIKEKLVYGLGVSYRENIPIPSYILEYPNTVIHVITAIDDIDKLIALNFPKILVLGCKDFGFNKNKLNTLKIDEWYRNIHLLFENQVCFDNLAVDQLNIRRFFDDQVWNTIYQGEESFYIDAANERFAPSSRSDKYVDWDDFNIKDYFRYIKNE